MLAIFDVPRFVQRAIRTAEGYLRYVIEPPIEVSFSLDQEITLGVPSPFSLSGQSDCPFRPEDWYINAPIPDMFLLILIKVGNIVYDIGPGVQDAHRFYGGLRMRGPAVSCDQRITVVGEYTGRIPPGYAERAEEAQTFSRTTHDPIPRKSKGKRHSKDGSIAAPATLAPASRTLKNPTYRFSVSVKGPSLYIPRF